jgi:HSP20 family protein
MSETKRELEVREKEPLAQEGTRPGPVFRPDVDILERDDAFLVYADLPGVDEDSVEVRIERGTLTLDAALATLPDPGWTPLRLEYHVGSFHREFRISEEIDPHGVSASMRAGVLELTLPKTAASKPRTIEVRAG